MFRKSTDGGVTFGSTINLSHNKGNSVNPAIAVSGDDVYVTWNDDTAGNREIFLRKSTDDGDTFGNIVNITNTAGSSGSHSIAASGDNVHVIWGEYAPGIVDIRYVKSSDGGDTFGPAQKLNDNFQDSGTPDIAVSGNNVYSVWQEDFPGSDEIFYRRSVDDGITFDSIVNFSDSASGSEHPAIATSGDNVYVEGFPF